MEMPFYKYERNLAHAHLLRRPVYLDPLLCVRKINFGSVSFVSSAIKFILILVNLAAYTICALSLVLPSLSRQ
jgi:hypothetical protein